MGIQKNKRIFIVGLILSMTMSVCSGWIHTHYSPNQHDDDIGPASKTYLTIEAFTEIILQDLALHQFDPDFLNIPIASMDKIINGSQVQFQMYLREAKVNPKFTKISQTNHTYTITSKNVYFSLLTHLTTHGRNYQIPATTKNGEFSIQFDLLFNEQGLIFANSTETKVHISNYTIPAGFFEPSFDQTTMFIETELPIQIRSIPQDAIGSVISYSFQQQLTDILRKWLVDQRVYDQISLDRNLTSLPSMSGGKVMIERNMFFYNNQQPKQRPNIPPPTYFPNTDDISHKQEDTLMVNEYFFNSLFYAMHNANMLSYTLTNGNIPFETKQKLTVYSLEHLIPGLKEMYVYDFPMIAEFTCISHPKTTILGEVFFLREPKVMVKVEGQMKLSVDTGNGHSLIGVFEITAHVELSQRIDVNQLFLYFEDVQVQSFKLIGQGDQNLQINVERVKNAVERLFLTSIPRLTTFLMLNHGIKLMPFDNVDLINSCTDIAPNHISTQTDLLIYEVTKNPYQSFPAMQMRLQNTLFDKVKKFFIQKIVEKIKTTNIPNTYAGYFWGFHVSANDMRLDNDISLDIANTHFSSINGGLNIHISHLDLKIRGVVQFTSYIDIWGWRIQLLSVGVHFTAKPRIATIDIDVGISLDSNRQLTTTLKRFDLDWNLEFHLENGDFASMADYVVHHIKLADDIDYEIKKRVFSTVEDLINVVLNNGLKRDFVFQTGDYLFIDLNLTQRPQFNPQFMEFQSSFFFTPSNITLERPPLSPPTLPEFVTNNRDIEFSIHQYALNSAAYFAFTKNKLNFLITYESLQAIDKDFQLTSNEFKWTIPGLYRKYGKDAKMNIGIESIFYPSVKISSQKLSASVAVLLDLQVRVPTYDSTGMVLQDEEEIQSAITIDCEVDLIAKISEEKGILKFSISDISFSKLEAFAAEVEPGILFKIFGHSSVNKILNLAIPIINKKLFADLGINLNQVVTDYFEISNIQIELNQNFIYVAADAVAI